MSFGGSRGSRQQVPQDSFYNDISQIDTPIHIDLNLDLFAFNQRTPEYQNQDDMETIIKWASPTNQHNKTKHKISGQAADKMQAISSTYNAPGKWVKSNEIINKKLLLSLNLGEQKKIGEINQSMISNNCSVILNSTVLPNKTVFIDSNKFVHYNLPPLMKSNNHARIFNNHTPLSNQQNRLYKLQHQSLIITKRLRSMEFNNKMFSYQISSLRKILIQIKSVTNKNTKLQTEFQPLISEIENSLQISSFIELSLEKVMEYQQMTKGVVREMSSSNTLMQLVKVICIKKIHDNFRKLSSEFQEIVRHKDYSSKGCAGIYLQEQIKLNLSEIQEVIWLFDQNKLRKDIICSKEEILNLLKSEKPLTQIEIQVLLEIGCSLP